MQRTRQLLAGLAIGGLALACAACGSPATDTTNAAEGTRTAKPTAAADQARAKAADPPMPTPPATTAGPLTRKNLPAADRLGSGFKPYTEPDAPEEGFVSNGQPVRQRDPKEVAASIVPLGCPGVDQLPPLPVPANALEQTYRVPGRQAAVALVLDYRSEASAARFVDGLADILAKCTPPSAKAKLLTARTVAKLDRPDARTLFDSRHDEGPRATPGWWDETVVQEGRRVGLAIVQRGTREAKIDHTALAGYLRSLLTR
ncbi:hypothetical protein SAMN05421678_102202 [Actinopolymorpha cephalotaxi]|uniref:PknH-like extracellular domain-containing protein n=1 Tax=Actinopolymorpha cephalotaxi TaxID=504797 RepID=A0A1I2LSV7_9ACTN|nr:hypothetical protein [Actinopolymorpha cephalotaxi]NYH81345.1 hypothetical protein [Actinopolymorpha cephalotaxi]SFF80151.1 hypothetical protein SAMN05421678_102202 [Actinopolymorpha cephalotaxi]